MSLYYYIEKGSRALRALYLLGKALSWDSVYIGTLLGTDDETAGHCSCPETHLLCRSPKINMQNTWTLIFSDINLQHLQLSHLLAFNFQINHIEYYAFNMHSIALYKSFMEYYAVWLNSFQYHISHINLQHVAASS